MSNLDDANLEKTNSGIAEQKDPTPVQEHEIDEEELKARMR